MTDTGLAAYANTDRQREIVETFERCGGSHSEAARQLGCHKRNVWQVMQAVQARAAMQGYAPDYDLTYPAPPGFKVRGTSTLLDEAGEKRLQWVKTSADDEAREQAMHAAAEAMAQEVPRASPEPPPSESKDDLAACYVLSDYHFGQLSYAPETGDSWDTDIAEDVLVRWFGAAIEAAPPAHTGVLAELGDLLHIDGVNLEAVTPASGNLLDADTRFQRLVRVAVRSLRRIVSMMLRKHEHVHLMLIEGNHDVASSVWLREMFSHLYEEEPRVTVDTSCEIFHCFEWGQTSLFFHHGHKVKMGDLSRTFAGRFRDVFGRTRYSYAHVGHLHHSASKEDNLMLVEQHGTLAPKDSHSARLGFTNRRGASVITYSRDYGEVGRSTIRPEMIHNLT